MMSRVCLLLAIFCVSQGAIAKLKIDNFGGLVAHFCASDAYLSSSYMQLKQAKQGIDFADEDKWLPELTLGLDVYYGRGSPTGFFSVAGEAVQEDGQPVTSADGEAWQAQVDVDLPIYEQGRWLGEDGAEQLRAKADYVTAKAELEKKRQESINLFAQYYFGMLSFKAEANLLEPIVESRLSQMESFINKVDAGVRTDVDLFAARTGYFSVKDQLDAAKIGLRTSIGYLEAMLRSPIMFSSLENAQAVQELASIAAQKALSVNSDEALARDPDIITLKSELELERQQRSLDKGSALPNVGLYMRLRSADDFDDASLRRFGEAGITFDYSLGQFLGSYRSSKDHITTMGALEAELQYLTDTKKLQWVETQSQLSLSLNRIKLAALEVEQKQLALASSEEKIDSGLIGFETLFNAEDEKLLAEISLLEEYRTAWLNHVSAETQLSAYCEAVD